MDAGLEAAGFATIAAVDNDPGCVDKLEANCDAGRAKPAEVLGVAVWVAPFRSSASA